VTIREALSEAARRLEIHHISNARLQSEVILAHCISADRTYLYTHDDRILTDTETQALEDALYDRSSGVPLQYIVGRQEFYGRDFHVTPAVLIPRPETEHIIEAVLELKPGNAVRILDVGTGSGCIAVTLALEIPGAQVFASDISEAALQIARGNAMKLRSGVHFVCMDLLEAVTGAFDFIVSNPPYVRPGDVSRLQREVREHEPRVALFADDDGLGIYRRIAPAAFECLRPGGYLVMEVGIGMDERVLELLGAGWETFPTKCDLQGIPRTVVARKR
jgi:release factor glutamine methyltransferase